MCRCELTQEVPSKESQRNHSLARQMEQVDCVNDLVFQNLKTSKETGFSHNCSDNITNQGENL